MKKMILSVFLLGLLAGCASQEKKEQKAAVEEKKPVTVQQESKPVAVTPAVSAAPKQEPVVNPLKDPNNILSKRNVYFDFDKSIVKDEFKPMIEAHAKYLAGNAAEQVVLQGNCDERGSREYNLALGHRRADSVKRMMVVLGVPDKRIETVSFGEEKPKAMGHDEASWWQNRRTDIVYKGE